MNWYFMALAVMWCTLWSVTAIVLGGWTQSSRPSTPHERYPWSIGGLFARVGKNRRVLHVVVLLVLVDKLYVLRYAPAAGVMATGKLTGMGPLLDLSFPVEWLIDETPLHEPLHRWAAVWGQRVNFDRISAARIKNNYWGDVPPWLYGSGWLLLGIVCVVGPAWILRLGVVWCLRRRHKALI